MRVRACPENIIFLSLFVIFILMTFYLFVVSEYRVVVDMLSDFTLLCLTVACLQTEHVRKAGKWDAVPKPQDIVTNL